MVEIIDAIARDLAHLQRNRGLQSGSLDKRLGRDLAVACGIPARPGANDRARFMDQLLYASHDLPDDLKFAFHRACAMSAEDAPTLEARIGQISERIDRSARVVRRRIVEANRLVAHNLQESARNDKGWFLAELHTSADLTHADATYIARRTVVITAAELDRVSITMSLPDAEVSSEPRFAIRPPAVLLGSEHSFPQTWRFTIGLDRSYRRGESATFESALRVPLDHASNMSVMCPLRGCRRFHTSVALGDLADIVWLIDGVTTPTLSHETPDLDSAQLVDQSNPSADFNDLTPGLVYGIRWLWRDGRPH